MKQPIVHRLDVAHTVGYPSSTGITVTKGFTPGEWIATASDHSLRAGQKVRIQE